MVMSSLDLQIHEQLTRYVNGTISLSAFREWFSPQAWNIDQRADISVARMVHEIDLALAEFDHGDWTEEEVNQLFASLIAQNSLIYFREAPWIQVLTSSVLGSPRLQLSQLIVTDQPR